MSDLPPSTLPPEEQPLTDRTDQDKDGDKSGDEERRESDAEKGSDGEELKKKDDQASEGSGSDHDESSPRRKKTSDGEEDSDEEGRYYRLIGGKKKGEFLPAGPLTTVLVSREDEERKRHKVRNRNKKLRMKKLARMKTRKYGPDGEEELDEDMFSSDEDERRRGGAREAPFLKQYKHKKMIEHKLDEEHYWSDPEEDKDPYRLHQDLDSSIASDDSSLFSNASGAEDDAGSRDDVRGVRKDGGKSPVDVEGEADADMKHGSKDGTKGSEGSHSSSAGAQMKDGEAKDIDISDEKRRLRDLDIENGEETDKKRHKASKKTTFITVKEQNSREKLKMLDDDDLDSLGRPKQKTGRRRRFLRRGSDGVSIYSDSSDGEDKMSEFDSGLDEEEELDVILTGDQRDILINSLFDSDGNLRPEFDTDEEGRILRRLDNSIIYDPSTGRFTFRKRLGRLFGVPRLKRSKSGRPTGGYIEDEYGPPISKDTKPVEQNGEEDGDGSEYRYGDDSRGENKAVGFMVTDDDNADIPMEQLQNGDYKGRGRRDIASAIRRKLNRRLFRKKRKRGDQNDTLPAIQVRNAWTTDTSGSMNNLPPLDHSNSIHPGLNPVQGPRGRSGRPPLGPRGLTLSAQRRLVGMTPEQMQLYRQGLESDRKILEGLQNKDGPGKTRPFEAREAFMELDGESSTDPPPDWEEGSRPEDGRLRRGNTYWTEDGRFVIRERGCPELQQQGNRLFTIVRRPCDMEKEHQAQEQHASQSQRLRAPVSAPITLEDFNRREEERNRGRQQGSQISLTNGGSAHGSHVIDDNRLRRLLEELYKDKKYFDNYVSKQEPKSEATVQSKGLAEHGRDYLLERAEYWDQRGPLPPRPPLTEYGWKMHRQQTMWGSMRTSEMGSSAGTFTLTPDPRPYTVPGTVESPREEGEGESKPGNINPTESAV